MKLLLWMILWTFCFDLKTYGQILLLNILSVDNFFTDAAKLKKVLQLLLCLIRTVMELSPS